MIYLCDCCSPESPEWTLEIGAWHSWVSGLQAGIRAGLGIRGSGNLIIINLFLFPLLDNSKLACHNCHSPTNLESGIREWLRRKCRGKDSVQAAPPPGQRSPPPLRPDSPALSAASLLVLK